MLILLTTIVMLAARWIFFSRYVDLRFEVFSYPVVRPPLCSIDVILRDEDNTFVLVSNVYQMYLSARSASKYCDHLKVFGELRSTGETISRSALGKLGEEPEETRARRGSKRFPLSESAMTQEISSRTSAN